MKLISYSTILCCLLTNVVAQKKQVCFTIDDMPLVTYGMVDSTYKKELMSKLVASVKRNKIPATGFVNEGKLYVDGIVSPSDVRLLEQWVDSDLDLGNHTYSHADYNSTSAEVFFENILRGETVTKKILDKHGKRIKYFRHPFLHAGSTKEKFDSLNQFLSDHHYTMAPISIDDDDYLFAVSYKGAKDKNDVTLMKKIGTDYISYMELKLKHFENQSNALFSRNIRHILLIHASLLNAEYMDLLAQMFTKNNYEFISLDNAIEDVAYGTPVSVYGRWGISWLDRWALSQGKKGDFFQGDPDVPEYIKELAK